MAVNTIDAKIKRLNNMGGYIAPRTAEILKHLVEQSQMQAVENVLLAQDLEKLKNDNRLFFCVIVTAWLAVAIMLGLLALNE
jgi:hypothetical protein